MKKLIVILGVVGAAFSAIFVRMSTMPSAVLVLYRMAFALIGICPGLMFFKEVPSITSCLGGGLIIAGIIMFSTYSSSSNS